MAGITSKLELSSLGELTGEQVTTGKLLALNLPLALGGLVSYQELATLLGESLSITGVTGVIQALATHLNDSYGHSNVESNADDIDALEASVATVVSDLSTLDAALATHTGASAPHDGHALKSDMIKVLVASWSGDGKSQRDITLSETIGGVKFMIIVGRDPMAVTKFFVCPWFVGAET